MKKFDKKSLDYSEQIELLKTRGLIIENEQEAINFLKYTNYYRLSSYMRHYQINSNHEFKEETTFNDIKNLYCFDRELKYLTFKYIKQIEIAVRAVFSHNMTTNYGSHWFYYDKCFYNSNDQQAFLGIIKNEIKYNDKYKETFIKYYYQKYNEPDLPPFWMAIEVFSIGNLSKALSKIKDNDGKQIAKIFNIPFNLLKSWLHSLTTVRNIAAHHSRLWNRKFTIAPKKHFNFSYHTEYNQNSFYAHAIIIEFLLKQITPDNQWKSLLKELFIKYKVDPINLGFPAEW
ncbi:MAG: Abi family protein [bacterium]